MDAANTGKGKAYTIADDKGPQDILLYDKQGVYVTPAYKETVSLQNKIFGKASFLLYTRNGEFVIAASETHVLVYSFKEASVIFEGDFNYIYSITLSPAESYLQILDKINTNEGKTLIYGLPKMQIVAQFKQNQFTGYFNKHAYPLVRFSGDDRTYFHYNNKILEVYGSTHEKTREIKTGPIEFFQVSKVSNEESYIVACIYLDKKNNCGNCELFSQKSDDEPFYKKNIKKAQEIKVRFSPTSNKFLMELQTYYDPTGKSYYGQFGLFLYNDENNKISTIKIEKGPVHDFSWSRDGKKFIVISGFMPATCCLFNQKNQILFEFGKRHRNTVYWGNLGRFVCLAGFGNLNGEMDMWDMETKQQIGYCKSSSASYCQWSPDDRKILTSIITPRLRVDNCYKVFSYTGTQLHKVNFDHTELYGAYWMIPMKYECQPRGISPGRKIESEPKKEEAKFKSFASAMNFGAVSLGEKKYEPKGPQLIPGQHPDDVVHKKKRKRKPKEPESLGPS